MSDTALSGKAAFISGSSRGIGLAIARRLAANGAEIFLAASNADRLKAAAAAIAAETGRRAEWHAGDLRTLEGCEAAHAAAMTAFGGIDILVNSAGATRGGRFPDQPDAEMIDGFALKFHGAVRLCRLFWPALKARHGTVVNIVGGAARTPNAGFLVGGSVNAALANFTKGLAAQGLQDDVNVNWVHPGLTVTDRMEELLARRAELEGKTRDEVEAESIAAEGLRRLGQPEDVAAIVAFLCAPEARHIHGTGIAVDGGGAKGYV
jgi:NAD(P)-dependent dehydrogenase (short-subunit alcohol dehydrogenase family)